MYLVWVADRVVNWLVWTLGYSCVAIIHLKIITKYPDVTCFDIQGILETLSLVKSFLTFDCVQILICLSLQFGSFWQLLHFQIKSNPIKSLLLSHHHSTSALVSEILKSVLQTVQKKQQFTYGQYIFTDCTEDNVQNTHTYTQYT